jgi:hypothetical protein
VNFNMDAVLSDVEQEDRVACAVDDGIGDQF